MDVSLIDALISVSIYFMQAHLFSHKSKIPFYSQELTGEKIEQAGKERRISSVMSGVLLFRIPLNAVHLTIICFNNGTYASMVVSSH